MAEEMTLENLSWESDEAVEDIEADEALAEAEESVEDIGERWRRGRPARPRHLPRTRGVRGMVVRGQDGRPRNLPFPARLATAEETNRGLASQEVRRRALEAQLQKFETRLRGQLRNGSSVSGLVYLVIGVPLSAWGAINPTKTGGTRLGNWAAEDTTKMAAVASATQLATSGAKLLVYGGYHRSPIGMAADAFAGAQLIAFAFGSMHKAEALRSDNSTNDPSKANLSSYAFGDLVLLADGKTYRVVDATGTKALRLIQ
jgi:hypothetical protein